MILEQSGQSGGVVLEARERAIELRVEGVVVGHEERDTAGVLQRIDESNVAIWAGDWNTLQQVLRNGGIHGGERGREVTRWDESAVNASNEELVLLGAVLDGDVLAVITRLIVNVGSRWDTDHRNKTHAWFRIVMLPSDELRSQTRTWLLLPSSWTS